MGGDQLLVSDVTSSRRAELVGEGILDVGARLWAGICQRYADYQRRGVAAAMHAVLSKLTDEELANRGIARRPRPIFLRLEILLH